MVCRLLFLFSFYDSLHFSISDFNDLINPLSILSGKYFFNLRIYCFFVKRGLGDIQNKPLPLLGCLFHTIENRISPGFFSERFQVIRFPSENIVRCGHPLRIIDTRN